MADVHRKNLEPDHLETYHTERQQRNFEFVSDRQTVYCNYLTRKTLTLQLHKELKLQGELQTKKILATHRNDMLPITEPKTTKHNMYTEDKTRKYA